MVKLMNQLLFNIFDGNDWTNLFHSIPGLIGRGLYYLIICAIARIVDICQLIFRKFAGLTDITFTQKDVKGTYSDWVLAFINSSIVQNVFWAMFVLAIIILLISVFVATIRKEFAEDGNNNKRQVIKDAFRGLAYFVIVPVTAIFGLIVGNALLRAIDGATNVANGQTTLSAQIFLVGGYNSNRARIDEKSGTEKRYEEESFGAYLVGSGNGSQDATYGYGNFGIFLDDESGVNLQRAADKIDDCFGQCYTLVVGKGIYSYAHVELPNPFGNNIKLDFRYQNNTATLNYSGSYTDQFWNGGYNKQFPDGKSDINGKVKYAENDELTFSIYNVGLVWYYYNLAIGIGGYDYLITSIALVFCGYIFLVTLLGLVKRLFMLVTLFIISAPICAIYPIYKDGLKSWKKEFINQALCAYSVVVVMNIFMTLLPLVMKIDLFTGNDLGFMSFSTGLVNYFARILIIIGGLTFFKDATKTISAMIASSSSYDTGSAAAGAFKTNVARVTGGIGAVASMPGRFAGGVVNYAKDIKNNGFASATKKAGLGALDAAAADFSKVSKGDKYDPSKDANRVSNGLAKTFMGAKDYNALQNRKDIEKKMDNDGIAKSISEEREAKKEKVKAREDSRNDRKQNRLNEKMAKEFEKENNMPSYDEYNIAMGKKKSKQQIKDEKHAERVEEKYAKHMMKSDDLKHMTKYGKYNKEKDRIGKAEEKRAKHMMKSDDLKKEPTYKEYKKAHDKLEKDINLDKLTHGAKK